MTVPLDAFEIASQFLDSGKKRNDLEVAILRHMEHHVMLERERCCQIVYGQCSSDNVAERTVRAIRGGKA